MEWGRSFDGGKLTAARALLHGKCEALRRENDIFGEIVVFSAPPETKKTPVVWPGSFNAGMVWLRVQLSAWRIWPSQSACLVDDAFFFSVGRRPYFA